MGSAPFDRLVAEDQGPYCSAPRFFWIMDNCSSHRGQRCCDRLKKRWPNIVVVYTPVHASWLNQVEIYFSVVQRKVLWRHKSLLQLFPVHSPSPPWQRGG